MQILVVKVTVQPDRDETLNRAGTGTEWLKRNREEQENIEAGI